jgi:hypothetical protein
VCLFLTVLEELLRERCRETLKGMSLSPVDSRILAAAALARHGQLVAKLGIELMFLVWSSRAPGPTLRYFEAYSKCL